MTNIDKEILESLCQRLFETYSKLDPHTFPPEKCKPIFAKMTTVISNMVPQLLTTKESYHYFQSAKHALEIDQDRMFQIQQKIFQKMMSLAETEGW